MKKNAIPRVSQNLVSPGLPGLLVATRLPAVTLALLSKETLCKIKSHQQASFLCGSSGSVTACDKSLKLMRNPLNIINLCWF